MSAYSNVVGGRLKLKKSVPGIASAPTGSATASATAVNRKRPADAPSSSETSTKASKSEEQQTAGSSAARASSSSHTQPGSGSGASAGAGVRDTRTEAQRRFDEIQAKRLAEGEARKLASKSHKERVQEFNALLEKLPEHNDLFKIQYAGTG